MLPVARLPGAFWDKLVDEPFLASQQAVWEMRVRSEYILKGSVFGGI